jgi:hypothetical protein
MGENGLVQSTSDSERSSELFIGAGVVLVRTLEDAARGTTTCPGENSEFSRTNSLHQDDDGNRSAGGEQQHQHDDERPRRLALGPAVKAGAIGFEHLLE